MNAQTPDELPVQPAQQPTAYDNNPFTITKNGIERLLLYAKTIFIVAIAFVAVGFIGNGISSVLNIVTSEVDPSAASGTSTISFEDSLSTLSSADVVVIVALFFAVLIPLLLFGTLVSGMADITSARVAAGKTLTFKQAFKGTIDRFWSYLWLQIILTVKILLWSLLLIVPGIIMAVRYSLAGVVFFSQGKTGNQAIAHSASLTKGAWLTTFASSAIWTIITLGNAELLITMGANSELYRSFQSARDNKLPHPPAHVLSWLTVIGLLMIVFTVFALIAFAVVAFTVLSGTS